MNVMPIRHTLRMVISLVSSVGSVDRAFGSSPPLTKDSSLLAEAEISSSCRLFSCAKCFSQGKFFPMSVCLSDGCRCHSERHYQTAYDLYRFPMLGIGIKTH